MIIEFILSLFFGILNFLLGLFSIPAAPVVFVDAMSKAIPFLATPVAIVRIYVGEQFFSAMITMIATAFSLFVLLRPGMWLYNKIRGSGGGN